MTSLFPSCYGPGTLPWSLLLEKIPYPDPVTLTWIHLVPARDTQSIRHIWAQRPRCPLLLLSLSYRNNFNEDFAASIIGMYSWILVCQPHTALGFNYAPISLLEYTRLIFVLWWSQTLWLYQWNKDPDSKIITPHSGINLRNPSSSRFIVGHMSIVV